VTFLAGLAASMLQWAIGKLIAYLVKAQALQDKYKEIEERTKREADAVKGAEDEEDLERVARDILSRK